MRLTSFHPHDGKHLPNARSSLGDPFRTIFRRSNAQTRLRSFRRNPTQVRLSALTVQVGRADVTLLDPDRLVPDHDGRLASAPPR